MGKARCSAVTLLVVGVFLYVATFAAPAHPNDTDRQELENLISSLTNTGK